MNLPALYAGPGPSSPHLSSAGYVPLFALWALGFSAGEKWEAESLNSSKMRMTKNCQKKKNFQRNLRKSLEEESTRQGQV